MSNMDVSDNDSDEDNEYYLEDVSDIEQQEEQSKKDPEYFVYEYLNKEAVNKLLYEIVEELKSKLKISFSFAKLLLRSNNWSIKDIICKYEDNTNAVMILQTSKVIDNDNDMLCPICITRHDSQNFTSLSCGHMFCKKCWKIYFEMQIFYGTAKISCMAQKCQLLVSEELILALITQTDLRDRFQKLIFADSVRSHPQLRFCPTSNCEVIIYSKDPQAKRCVCIQCKLIFCFICGDNYHAPADCLTIKKWLAICKDDSETIFYINVNTTFCPHCGACIQKNGGCNHMQCFICKYHFCWLCMDNWETHDKQHYECSRYKEGENMQNNSQAILKNKYLHYFKRWSNHYKSLRLEEQTFERMKARLNDKIKKSEGTLADWQYLFTAASLLAKCRYTLQYTYPYAFFMEPGLRKNLFEYQQAQLEAEIEDLSWKIERVKITDRPNFENQMNIAEKRRLLLLKDFRNV